MGNVIKNLNKKELNLNITAVYTAQQTKNILKILIKKQKYNFLFLLAEWEM